MTDGPVLGVFAHPDDAEICAGGTLAKWAAVGREVHLLILTNGDRGSQDAARLREDVAAVRVTETEDAARIMGIASVRILGTHDGELENTASVRETVVRRVREVRAGTVVSCDPTAIFFESRYYNHADHRNAGWIALDAAFPASGNPHFFAEQLAEGLTVQEVTDVWLGWSNEPNHREDITGFLRTKIDALAAHPSQLEEGIRYFDESLTKDAAEEGARLGVEHAEPFRRLDLT
ncbi:MAG TPA: PIG-L deacetylase family protein [Actinomycetota bacterium]|nr:PIG-L deacetylase family protein [Actinomycetota bacterium]